MRSALHLVVLSLCAFLPVAAGQVPGTPDQPDQQSQAKPVPPGDRPLSPAEQREQEIRKHDPLNPAHPLLENRGQDAGLAGAADTSAPVQRAAPPLPGSVAESNLANARNGTGPQVLTEDDQASAQNYSGPAVLSRSYTISRPQLPRSVHLVPTLGFSEIYQTGLPAYGSSGTTTTISSSGYVANWSMEGRYLWKHDLISVDYRASLTRYTKSGATGGTNHSINMGFQHLFSRRLVFSAASEGSVISQNYSLSDPAVGTSSLSNISLSASPNVQLTNYGTRQWSNQASIKWLKSSRMVITAGGGLFFVDRTGFGNAKIGTTGYQAQADLSYRYTRKTTIGTYYTFTDYAFSHRLSLANLHTIGGIYSYALNRTTQLQLRAGITALESESLASVAIPAEVARLTGQHSGVVDLYRRSLTSDLSAKFAKDLGRNRTLSFSYARGVSPGNGLVQTSLQQSFSGTVGMIVKRHYHVNVMGGSDSLTSQTASESAVPGIHFGSRFVSGGISREYRHGITGEIRVDYRKFDVTSYSQLNTQVRISTGISWSPGENWVRSLQR